MLSLQGNFVTDWHLLSVAAAATLIPHGAWTLVLVAVADVYQTERLLRLGTMRRLESDGEGHR